MSNAEFGMRKLVMLSEVSHAERSEASAFRDETLRCAQGDTVLRMTFRIHHSAFHLS